MKKPDAVTEISLEDFREKVWPLHCSEMIYCGPATARKLENCGIRTIGDVAQTDPAFLKRLLGVNGPALWQYAAGQDMSRVAHKDHVSPIKSVGHGITCVTDLVNEEEVFRVMLELAQDVGHRLSVHELTARGVQISIRANDLIGFQFRCRLPVRTQLPAEIAAAGFRLFQERYKWNNLVRAVCIRAIDLAPKALPEQLTVFDDAERRDRMERLQDAIEDVRTRYGKRALTYAALLKDLKMPDDGRDSVKMPGLMYS